MAPPEPTIVSFIELVETRLDKKNMVCVRVRALSVCVFYFCFFVERELVGVGESRS